MRRVNGEVSLAEYRSREKNAHAMDRAQPQLAMSRDLRFAPPLATGLAECVNEKTEDAAELLQIHVSEAVLQITTETNTHIT
jgi:hypothetical protein